MTTEEKARAYDEALERAKEFQKSKDGLCVLTAESIFPQLKESKDEKIRKGLIDIFNTALGQDFLQRKAGLNRDEVITYLEKQKPAECSKATINGEPIPTENYSVDIPLAEWSEEDEKYLNRVINLWVNDFGEDSDTVKWLKSLRPSWKPSDEQLKYLLMLADYFESKGGTLNAKTLRELYENLKKL